MAIVKYVDYDYKKSLRPKYSEKDLCEPDMALSVRQILDNCIRSGTPIPFCDAKNYDPVIDQGENFEPDAPIEDMSRDFVDQERYSLFADERIKRVQKEIKDSEKENEVERNDSVQNEVKPKESVSE